jgi:hypothetical protein
VTPADRIAALEAELAEARGQRDSYEQQLLACRGDLGETTAVAIEHHNELAELLDAERDAHARTQAELTEARTSLAILRNAVHGHCTTEACTGERGCWCDDCIAERSQKYADGMLSPWQLPATEKARAGRAIAERVPLWRELERVDPMDRHAADCSCRRCIALRKLAALDEKGGGQ